MLQVRIDLQESSVLENPAAAAGHDNQGVIQEDEEYIANGTS